MSRSMANFAPDFANFKIHIAIDFGTDGVGTYQNILMRFDYYLQNKYNIPFQVLPMHIMEMYLFIADGVQKNMEIE